MGEVVDPDVQGVVLAEHDFGKGVADKDDVDAGGVHHPGEGRVVSGDHHDRLGSPAAFARAYLRHRHCSCHFRTSSRPAHSAAGGQSAVGTSRGENAQEMVPGASGADFDQITRHFGTFACRLGEHAHVGHRQAAWGQAGAEREHDVDELLLLADGAFGVGVPTEVLRDPEQLGLGVADLGPTEAAAPVLPKYRLADQAVLDPAGARKTADSPTRLRTAPDARHRSQATVPATGAPTVEAEQGPVTGFATAARRRRSKVPVSAIRPREALPRRRAREGVPGPTTRARR